MVELSWNLSYKLCCLCCHLKKMLVLLYLPFECGCAIVYGAAFIGYLCSNLVDVLPDTVDIIPNTPCLACL